MPPGVESWASSPCRQLARKTRSVSSSDCRGTCIYGVVEPGGQSYPPASTVAISCTQMVVQNGQHAQGNTSALNTPHKEYVALLYKSAI